MYSKEWAMDLALTNNGWMFGLNFGKLETYYKTKFWHVSIGEIKHERETRRNISISTPNQISRSYVFGKQNNLYVLRGGWGQKVYLSEKAKRKGVAVGYSYEFGPSLGLLKPYYLEVVPTDGSPGFRPQNIRYSEADHDLFTNTNRILGPGGWANGLGQLSPAIGGHARIAAHFDFGAFDDFVRAIEGGIMIDAFARRMPILVADELNHNRPVFINFFVNVQLGGRS